MSEVVEESTGFHASTPGIGERLKKTRESKHLSVAETASRLRLTRATINSLESEDWENMHGRTYARGYLISYSKFLGLPVDEMLSVFNSEYGEVERPTSLLIKKTVQQAPEPRWPLWLMFGVLAAVIIMATVMWSASNTAQNDNDATPAMSEQDDEGVQISPNNEQDVRDVIDDEVPAGVPVVTESPNDLQQDSVNDASPEVIEIETQQAGQSTSTDELTEPESEASSATDAESADAAANQPASLQLQVGEDSWIEVKNADGETLLSRVLAQETVDLTGKAPLAVRVGNVASTEIRFNDTPVNLDEYRRNNVASLTLGGGG